MTTTTQATVSTSVRAHRDRLVAEACARIRDGVPVLDRDEHAAALGATVRGGIDLFLDAWAERRPLSPADLATLSLGDAATADDVHVEDALHAHRIVVEVVREDIARTVAEGCSDVTADQLLRELGRARALEDQITGEVLARARELDRRAATERCRLEQGLIDALLATPVDVERARDRLRQLGLGVDGAWTVAAAASDGPDRLRTTLRPVATVTAVGTWQGTTLAVTSANRAELAAALRGHGPAGIARSTRDLQQARGRCEEAAAVLEAARRRGGDVLSFDETRLELVLMGAMPATELAAELLAPLDELDDDRRVRVVETLTAYLDAACSVTAAARRLHLHRESFRYRLQQATGLFRDQLEDPDRRLALHLALRARRLCPTTADPTVG